MNVRHKLLTRPQAELRWSPRDLWVGVRWEAESGASITFDWHIWVCLIPGLPLHVWWTTVDRDWCD